MSLSTLPRITCLCPTWHRPKLVANTIAMFLQQTYQGSHRLLILDDAGQYGQPQHRDTDCGKFWEIISFKQRYYSLPEKFNALVGMSDKTDVFVIFEDDDIFLPWYLEKIAAAAQAGAQVIKPGWVWSNYGGGLNREKSDGRFHGAMAFTRKAFESAGGWPLTRRADFDQQFIARLAKTGPVYDPCSDGDPRGAGFAFRWGNGYFHCQGLMRSPDDETWYTEAASKGDPTYVETVIPLMDEETRRVYDLCADSTYCTNAPQAT